MNKTKVLKIKTGIVSWTVVLEFIWLGLVNPTIRIELIIIYCTTWVSAILFGMLMNKMKKEGE